LSILGPLARKEREVAQAGRNGETERQRRREQETKITYGDSPFRQRTRTRWYPGGFLAGPFPRFLEFRSSVTKDPVAVDLMGFGWGRGSHELPQSSTPEFIAFRFRKVGMLNQKSVPITRYGPCEQFVVRLGDRHDVCASGAGNDIWYQYQMLGVDFVRDTALACWGAREAVARRRYVRGQRSGIRC
jgi:hypothetical protein